MILDGCRHQGLVTPLVLLLQNHSTKWHLQMRRVGSLIPELAGADRVLGIICISIHQPPSLYMGLQRVCTLVIVLMWRWPCLQVDCAIVSGLVILLLELFQLFHFQ